MNPVENTQWREACRRVDEAASLLEEAHLGDENGVWDAREHWRMMSCRWLEGKGNTEDILAAAQAFVAAVESVAPPRALRPVYPFNEPGEPVPLARRVPVGDAGRTIFRPDLDYRSNR